MAVCVLATQEGFVIRNIRISARFAVCIAVTFVLALQICPAAWSQDPPPSQTPPPQTTPPQQTTAPPSLGDVARKYREEKAAQDKNQATPKNTFTNDGFMSGKGGELLGAGVPSIAGNQGAGSAFADAMAKMDDAIQKLDQLGSLDHAALFNMATQGISADFPGRKAWEDRLVAARQGYVVHGKELIQSTKALMLDAKTLHDAQPNLPEDDPRVKSFTARLQAKMNEAQKMTADFKAVVDEGRDRAVQAVGH
jgi:hypothetical protein